MSLPVWPSRRLSDAIQRGLRVPSLGSTESTRWVFPSFIQGLTDDYPKFIPAFVQLLK